jgi:hypothetical protein
MWNPRRYQALLNDLGADPTFEAIFERKGVFLFKHRHISHSDLGAMTTSKD